MATTNAKLSLSLSFVAHAVMGVVAFATLARAEPANPRGVAVIIGNVGYEHRDVPPVDFAHRDAEAFRRYVVDVLGYDLANVIDLHDASRRELRDVFGTRSNPEGLLWSYLDPAGGSDVVVFYSGHGVPGTDDGRGYLLPVDGDPNAAADDGYPIDLLYRNVGGFAEARSVQVYLDACFSGGSHAGQSLIRNASPVYVAATLPEEVAGKVTALAAASGEQVASWDEAAGHGLFTHHLLDALYGGGDADGDGAVTAEEAKAYLDRHMTRAARRQHRRIQRASLVGAADAVLASAAEAATFPDRPKLTDVASTEVRTGDARTVSPLDANSEAVIFDILGEARADARSIESPSMRSQVLEYIARVRARAGDTSGAILGASEALDAAREIKSPSIRASNLGDIAQAQAKFGDTSGAARTISEALAVVRGMEALANIIHALCHIIKAQAEAGDHYAAARMISEALNTAPRVVEVEGRRARALVAIAETQAAIGDIQGALATARSIKGPLHRATALEGIAGVQSEAGDEQGASRSTSEALATLPSINDSNNWPVSWPSKVALAQARLGAVPSGLTTAGHIPSASDRAWVLAEIASVQAETGDRQGALHSLTKAQNALESVTSPDEIRDRDWALEAIALAYATLGDVQRANTAALGIGSNSSREKALISIAAVQAQAGDTQGALAVARSIDDADRRGAALLGVVWARATAGDSQSALSVARSIGGAMDRALALTSIVHARVAGTEPL